MIRFKKEDKKGRLKTVKEILEKIESDQCKNYDYYLKVKEHWMNVEKSILARD